MYQHILIPTDGSEIAEKAVEAGTNYAREAGAKVLFFTAVPEYQPPSEADMMAHKRFTFGDMVALAIHDWDNANGVLARSGPADNLKLRGDGSLRR